LITDERKGEGFQLTAIVLFACIAIGIAMGNQELAEELKRIFMVDFQIEKYDCDNESVRKVSYDSDRFLENIGVASVLIIIFSIPTATIILLKIIGNHFYKIDKWENPYKSK
jgi:hypothetical protein